MAAEAIDFPLPRWNAKRWRRSDRSFDCDALTPEVSLSAFARSSRRKPGIANNHLRYGLRDIQRETIVGKWENRSHPSRVACVGDGVRLVSDRAKKKHRTFADLASLYGADVGSLERQDYEKFVGLWLNRKREATRKSEIHRIGFLASQSQLGLGWFLDTKESDDEAIACHDEFIASFVAETSS